MLHMNSALHFKTPVTPEMTLELQRDYNKWLTLTWHSPEIMKFIKKSEMHLQNYWAFTGFSDIIGARATLQIHFKGIIIFIQQMHLILITLRTTAVYFCDKDCTDYRHYSIDRLGISGHFHWIVKISTALSV